jgi:nucleotidyltransferase/DNA polymerase involved in DNA repair
VKRDFRWYEVLSRMMLDLVRDLSPRVEYYSIDEFFFEAHPPHGMDQQGYAVAIRDRIMDAVRVPVTVGIARSKTLAKLISDSARPFGAKAVLDRESELALLASDPVTEISGIAGRREKRLLPWGTRTCLDLANADRRLIRQLLTATGEALWWELNGEAVLPIHPKRLPHKRLSRGGSFGESTDKPDVLHAWLVRNLERLVEELEFHEVRTGKVVAWVGYRDGRAGEGNSGLVTPTNQFDVLLDAFRFCLRQAWIPRAMASRMHLFADQLTPAGQTQLALFDRGDERAVKVAALKKAVNESQGRFALRSAATLPLFGIYQDRANEYDICDVRGKACF